jgi:4-aminobutyrate---pyruvate transaminase
MDTVLPNSTAHNDILYHIHSQTNPLAHEHDGPFIATRGEGAHVFDGEGRRYVDAMAGLWCASLGFSNTRLIEAATKQYEKMGFYHTFFHRTNPAVADLAEKLVQLSGMEGGKAYFATSGSEANETMVKMTWLYHKVHGNPEKRKIIARNRAFHGSTIAAASMCGLPFMHREYGLPLPGFLHTTTPDPYHGPEAGEAEAAFLDRLMADLEALILAEGPETVGGFIAEPIMAGGGIIVPPAGYFARVREVLDRYGILLLADEIVCGFHRTGNWFGQQTVAMKPDMMSLAKGLSSSYFPISAVVVSAKVYDALLEFNRQGGVFGHGFTNSGHPVGAAVAAEAIKIYEELDMSTHVRMIGDRLRKRLDSLAEGSPIIGQVRGAGLMIGIELVADKASRTSFPTERKVGGLFDAIALRHGLIMRCMGDTVALSPPLMIDEAVADEILEKFEATLAELTTAVR